MPVSAERRRVVAVLGPTNTGKTYLAIERMLGHRTGMIGFPLRLLARENYDRVVRLKGPAVAALITGEERILPPNPAYFLCTVEAMPLDRAVDFLAVDEIHLAADRERGHVFTNRLLHARGDAETMFLGAETISRLVRRLIPEAEFVTRPRFSTLSYAGTKKLSRLPRRSAVVAFSAAEVYGIGESIRRQRGGAALVFGALSPRTRNAQVAMFQDGQVDYLVATDAIGMGLNMDIDHVAFAALTKFDGRAPRRLTAAEIAQIAGRAGRHMRDGTFGTTGESGPLDAEMVAAVEEHRFPKIEAIYWRNDDLDFSSVAALLGSLDRPTPAPALIRVRDSSDQAALAALAQDTDIMAVARGRNAVRLLWDICQIPDYRKMMSDGHTRLLGQMFHHLSRPAGRLPEDWVAAQVARLDRSDGDIDTLLARIANIRTWTYVSHRPDWLERAAHWQERTREVEDRLSDALHERLTQRFVDRRAAALISRLGSGAPLVGAVTRASEVIVEGGSAGRLQGFSFIPAEDFEDGGKALRAAVNRTLRADIGARVRRFAAEADAAFGLAEGGRILWEQAAVARLAKGDNILSPRIEVLPSDLLEPALREAVRRRLVPWIDARISAGLQNLFRLRDASFTGAARGLAFQLVEALGVVPREAAAKAVASITLAERRSMERLGVRFGETAIFLPSLMKERAIRMRGLLWAIHAEVNPAEIPCGRLSVPRDGVLPVGLLAACGFMALGPRWVRVDRAERLATAAHNLARQGPFSLPRSFVAIVGRPIGEIRGVLGVLGYRSAESEAGLVFTPAPSRRRRGTAPAPFKGASPFASLRQLVDST